MKGTFSILLLFLMAGSAYATCTFLPENDLLFPPGPKAEGLSERKFNQVINKVEAHYRPLIEELGFELKINRQWSDARVNAGATKKRFEWILNLYGGFARHPMITEDGYALVVCHELGHHIGGAPKKAGDSKWAGVEGQADYFATLKCLRKVFQNDNNRRIVSKDKVPEYVKNACSQAYIDKNDVALCIRSAMAGISVANISADSRRQKIPSIITPDRTVVTSTYPEHPDSQCRLDTYFQGSLCNVGPSTPVSNENEERGTCFMKKLNFSFGVRPLCWFKPK